MSDDLCQSIMTQSVTGHVCLCEGAALVHDLCHDPYLLRQVRSVRGLFGASRRGNRSRILHYRHNSILFKAPHDHSHNKYMVPSKILPR
jgi:hypothetical protein